MRGAKKFSSSYPLAGAKQAEDVRLDFLKAFPKARLSKMSIEDYVLGRGRKDSFCYLIEVTTKDWANIVGATALKFGIYFGRTKLDQTRKYRFVPRFGNTSKKSFEAVKECIVKLVDDGGAKSPDFMSIEQNLLSPMLKAKILSIYYPEKFLNICSSHHLRLFAEELGIDPELSPGEIQHRLVMAMRSTAQTSNWPNPKFTAYLYETYFPRKQAAVAQKILKVFKPKGGVHQNVDFDEINKLRQQFGRKAEIYAMAWERKRLHAEGLKQSVPPPQDVHDQPSRGYDILSHSAVGVQRFIEVKSARKTVSGYRIYLSSNEEKVSKSTDFAPGYYFYLVIFQGKKPKELVALLASEIYPKALLTPASYIVSFRMT